MVFAQSQCFPTTLQECLRSWRDPCSTSSAGNGPQVVQRPAGATLSVPPNFKVRLFADGLSGPRLLRVAPNGDIFIAETRANRIRVLRAADGALLMTEDGNSTLWRTAYAGQQTQPPIADRAPGAMPPHGRNRRGATPVR
jgi:glucose/arabinose dehydrogenase